MKQAQDLTIRSVIVDDDRTIGDVLKDLVSKEHVSVKVFNDGLEAVEFITREPVDVVITDLLMPRIGGMEVLRQAKAMNPDVVVIIITGHGSLETAIEAIHDGAYEYIKKPFIHCLLPDFLSSRKYYASDFRMHLSSFENFCCITHILHSAIGT